MEGNLERDTQDETAALLESVTGSQLLTVTPAGQGQGWGRLQG